MKKSRIIFLMTSILLGATPAVAGDVYAGVWSGVPTDTVSIEIVSDSPLEIVHCFMDYCETARPKGGLDKMILVLEPRGDFEGATVTFSKKFGAYVGEFHHKDDRRYFARLKKVE